MLALVVVAAMLLLVAIMSQRSERSQERIAPGPIFPGLTAEAVADIQLTTDADTVHLVLQDDLWVVATEGHFPADTTAVGRLLEKLDIFDRRYRHSTNPEKQVTFEVDDASGTEVRLGDASGTALAHFRLGKNGPDFRSQFIRPVDSDEVFRLPDYLASAYQASRATWREKRIFTFDADKVGMILITPEEGEALHVGNLGDDGYVFLPDSAAVKKQAIESAVRRLSNLRCDAFPDTVPSLEDAGLLPPLQQVEVMLTDGASHVLEIGATESEENARFYVKRAGKDTIYLLSRGQIGGLLPDRETLAEVSPEPSAPE